MDSLDEAWTSLKNKIISHFGEIPKEFSGELTRVEALLHETQSRVLEEPKAAQSKEPDVQNPSY